MSGTWLQEGFYGTGLQPSVGLTGKESDEELLDFARKRPAVAAARRLCHSWVIVTAIYRGGAIPQHIMPPRSYAPLNPACWLAFVDRAEHETPGWNQVGLTLFPEYERNNNVVKVFLPLLFPESSIFYLDYTLTHARCFAAPHLLPCQREPLLNEITTL